LISALAVARLAFAQSRTLAEGLLTTAAVNFKLDNARLSAEAKALTTGADAPDVQTEEENILAALKPRKVDKRV